MNGPMRLLHTSDWHLGHTLNGRSRHREFTALLAWMLRLAQDEHVDIFLVAGDVFDTSSPSPVVQRMYYDFLRNVSKYCRQTVIVAGNHDSPLLLDAPRDLLQSLNVHVVGTAAPDNELLVVRDEQGTPTALIGAVPFLRDRDLRLSETGESMETKEQKSVAGLMRHYLELCRRAEEFRNASGQEIPLIVTGHLFVRGAQTSEGVRELHVGNLGQFGTDVFPAAIDYLALGHLHISQLVDGSEVCRYSGSPIPIGFDEAAQRKNVLLVDFDGRTPVLHKVGVPGFANLVSIRGELSEIEVALKTLKPSEIDTYVDIIYDGREAVADLWGEINRWNVRNIDILRVRNEREFKQVGLRTASTENLQDLDPIEVFKRLVAEQREQKKEIGADQETDLLMAFQEILETVR